MIRSFLWIGIGMISALLVIHLWPDIGAQPPDKTAEMKQWLGNAVPSSKLRVHRQ